MMTLFRSRHRFSSHYSVRLSCRRSAVRPWHSSILTDAPAPSPCDDACNAVDDPGETCHLCLKRRPSAQDWLQLARNAQRSNDTPHQVDPPYCYIWKWYEVPFASRAQPVVVAGRLFIGGMDGVLCAMVFE